jgi:hypothetical protein
MAEILEGETLKIGVKNRQANANGNGTAEPERINHPAHYQLGGGVEVIDIAERLNFNRGNAVKYLCRAGRKTTAETLDDLLKARWYVDREVQRIRNEAAEANRIAEENNAKGAAWHKAWTEAEARNEALAKAGVPLKFSSEDLPPFKAEPSATAEPERTNGNGAEASRDLLEAFAEMTGVPEWRRRQLVEYCATIRQDLSPRWQGRPVTIGGWKNPCEATLITSKAGFYAVAWTDVNEVFLGKKTFDQCNVRLTSNAWLGSEG